MPGTEPDLEKLLDALVRARVEFIVVGGVCAVLHGAPVSTFDLDVVHARTPENLDRLANALEQLGAHYREKPQIRPDAVRLDTPGHHLLMTDHGPLDILGSLTGGGGYTDLIQHTESVDLGEGASVVILDLPTLVHLKKVLDRERDRAVLPILRKTLEERGRKES